MLSVQLRRKCVVLRLHHLVRSFRQHLGSFCFSQKDISWRNWPTRLLIDLTALCLTLTCWSDRGRKLTYTRRPHIATCCYSFTCQILWFSDQRKHISYQPDGQIDVGSLSSGCQESLFSRHLTAERREASVLFHPDLPSLNSLTWQRAVSGYHHSENSYF